jgi:TetR/AcrR family transcriptional regulator
MTIDAAPLGRREKNKQDKLARIVAAADELFSSLSVDDVTTAQIAARAGVGTGTLFLYAANKAELLMLVQNARYAAAVEQGRNDGGEATDVMDALLAFAAPLVRCNRRQVDNGRHYLREILFGQAHGPHHADAAAIAAESLDALTGLVVSHTDLPSAEARLRATMVSNVILMALVEATNTTATDNQILARVAEQSAILMHVPTSTTAPPIQTQDE